MMNVIALEWREEEWDNADSRKCDLWRDSSTAAITRSIPCRVRSSAGRWRTPTAGRISPGLRVISDESSPRTGWVCFAVPGWNSWPDRSGKWWIWRRGWWNSTTSFPIWWTRSAALETLACSLHWSLIVSKQWKALINHYINSWVTNSDNFWPFKPKFW